MDLWKLSYVQTLIIRISAMFDQCYIYYYLVYLFVYLNQCMPILTYICLENLIYIII